MKCALRKKTSKTSVISMMMNKNHQIPCNSSQTTSMKAFQKNLQFVCNIMLHQSNRIIHKEKDFQINTVHLICISKFCQAFILLFIALSKLLRNMSKPLNKMWWSLQWIIQTRSLKKVHSGPAEWMKCGFGDAYWWPAITWLFTTKHYTYGRKQRKGNVLLVVSSLSS